MRIRVQLYRTRANGAVVDVPPNRTRIDFAQLTELPEFLTAATVPQGSYPTGRSGGGALTAGCAA